jgi:hypothetical protein
MDAPGSSGASYHFGTAPEGQDLPPRILGVRSRGLAGASHFEEPR